MPQDLGLVYSGTDQAQQPPPAPPAPGPPPARRRAPAAPAGVQLDWSTAQDAPAAAATPAPRAAAAAPTAAAAPPQVELDWSTAQDAPVAEPDTGFIRGVERGLRKTFVDFPVAIKDAFTTPPQNEEDNAWLAASGLNIPPQVSLGIKRLLFDPQYAEWRKGEEQTPQPGDDQWNNAEERTHMHRIAALTPLVGPLAANLAERWLSGDKTGALGELMVYNEIGARVPEATAAVAPPIVRGTARGINYAMENAPTVGAYVGGGVGSTAGSVLGHATGLPGATGALGTTGGLAGAAIGVKLGELIQKLPRVPGERFGLQTTPGSFADFVKQRYGQDIPESNAAAPADLLRQISKASDAENMGLSEAQIRGIATDITKAAGVSVAGAKAAAAARRPAAAAPAEAVPGYTRVGGEPEQQPAAGPAPGEPQPAAPAERGGVAPAGAQESPYAYTRRGAGDPEGVRSVLGLPVVESWSLDPDKVAELQQKGYQSPDVHEIDASHPDAARTFQNRIAQTKVGNKYAASVHVYTPEEYAQTRMFLTENGKAGFALKPDGDIVSVFVHGDGPKGAVHTMLEIAKQAGGNKLDAFDTVLPEIYGNHGFTAVSRIPWSDEFAPEGWNKQTFAKYNGGEPDVVFMAHNPDAVPYRPGDGVRVADYDQAVEAQQAAVDRFAPLRETVERGEARAAAETEARRQQFEEMQRQPAAEEAAPAPAEKPAAAPRTKPVWKTHEELSQHLFGQPYQTLVDMYGKAGARERLQPYYETQERLLAKSEGRIVGTDRATLTKLGWSKPQIDNLTYEQAEDAAAKGLPPPEEETAPAEAVPATEAPAEAAQRTLKERFEAAIKAIDEATDPSKMHAGFDPLPLLKSAADIGSYYFENGIRDFGEWSEKMLEHGEWMRPYLQKIYNGVSQTDDHENNMSTRNPMSGSSRWGATLKVPPSENPVKNQLHVKTDDIFREPALPAKISNAIQRGYQLKEPTRGGYDTDAQFQRAHDAWQANMDNQYVGVKIDPAIADNPRAVMDSFKGQAVRNLKKVFNFVPEAIRQITRQWYDTARNEIVQDAQANGLENRQAAGVYASLSPQKDWFMNKSLAQRLFGIWKDQQDAVYDSAMRKKLGELTLGGENPDLKAVAKTFDDLTFSEMSTEQKAAFARLYDEANNDPSYNAQSPDGQDLGPVQKQNPKKGKDQPKTVNAKVAWGSLDEITKAMSILEDGSIENIHKQLLGSHKVPNFYNNMLTPNHPAEYVTIDTHAVAAALIRPLSQKAIEVQQNFSGPGSKVSGTDGTYPVLADAYRDAAHELSQELGYQIQPRELQSITWEAIRDIFPAKWKNNPANLAKINRIWRDFENGDATFDETFDKIIDARGGKNIDWSAARRGSYVAEETE